MKLLESRGGGKHVPFPTLLISQRSFPGCFASPCGSAWPSWKPPLHCHSPVSEYWHEGHLETITEFKCRRRKDPTKFRILSLESFSKRFSNTHIYMYMYYLLNFAHILVDLKSGDFPRRSNNGRRL